MQLEEAKRRLMMVGGPHHAAANATHLGVMPGGVGTHSNNSTLRKSKQAAVPAGGAGGAVPATEYTVAG